MLLSSVELALEALARNILRSVLTALGILIGAGAVIAMVTIGQGASSNVRNEIARLGSDLLTLTVGQRTRGGQGATVNAAAFDYADIEAIRSELRGLRRVAPLSSRPMRATARSRNWTVRLVGTENEYFEARGWALTRGRMFTEFETYNGKGVCLIGETARQRLFGDHEAVGDFLRLGSMSCTVIGILSERGQSGAADDDDNTIAIPFDAYQRRIQGAPDVHGIVMAAYPSTDLDRLKLTLTGLMRERRGLSASEENDFSLLDMRQVAQSMASATRTMTLFLGAIAAVSLVVGGIGIMNIMLVSVTERTREIGVRLAIGALPSQIRLQFLCEAVVLTVIGGMAGVALGLAVAATAAPNLGIPFLVDVNVIVGTLLISAILGIGFGYAPASKAAALNPVEALRQ